MQHDLVNRILQGNDQAVESFYRTYAPRIKRYIRRKVQKTDCEELLNDVFLDAIDSLALLKDRSKLSSYLYSIAHNKIADYYRKNKIKSILFSQIPYLEMVSDDFDRPDFQYEKNAVRDRIEQTFHSLSASYRTVLCLRYVDDLPVKQIAVTLNMSFKAAESMLYRARQDFIKKYYKW